MHCLLSLDRSGVNAAAVARRGAANDLIFGAVRDNFVRGRFLRRIAGRTWGWRGMERTRGTAIFRGHVQGVGFRYTALDAARGFQVTGYVCNEPDGTVEVVAEGARDEVERFIDAVRNEMSHYVSDVKLRWSNATNEFHNFTVRF
jgi:acylphosphatase